MWAHDVHDHSLLGLAASHLWLRLHPAPLPAGLIIDARSKGNLARLLNSSCDPNCETQKWHDAGNSEVGSCSALLMQGRALG